jgi:hypothetical protein
LRWVCLGLLLGDGVSLRRAVSMPKRSRLANSYYQVLMMVVGSSWRTYAFTCHIPHNLPQPHFVAPCLPGCMCRNLLDSYYLGRVIGAGSFGVVREGIKVATGKRFAVKTVSKVPKRGAPTPRFVPLSRCHFWGGVRTCIPHLAHGRLGSVTCAERCLCTGCVHWRRL